jgi:hypothetical protein
MVRMRHMGPEIQQLVNSEQVVLAVVCEALQHRLKILLSNVSACLDHYRVEVEGRGVYKAVGAQLGCAACALEAQQGGLLAPCTACCITFYCSECSWSVRPLCRNDCVHYVG